MHEDLNRMARQGIPVVAWGEQYKNQDYFVVGSDNFNGSYRATSHLARLGREKIAFVGDTQIGESQLRYRGYVQALNDAGLELYPELVMHCPLYPEAGFESVENALAHGIRFDAVTAACDAIAFGTIRALAEHKISVPNEVSVAGYDDVPMAAYYNPPLTTIRQDTVKAGKQLVRKAMRMLQGEEIQSSYLSTDLIIRGAGGA